VRVLGPVEVESWRRVPDRAIVTELACYLALHTDRAMSGDELRFALRPDMEAAGRTWAGIGRGRQMLPGTSSTSV